VFNRLMKPILKNLPKTYQEGYRRLCESYWSIVDKRLPVMDKDTLRTCGEIIEYLSANSIERRTYSFITTINEAQGHKIRVPRLEILYFQNRTSSKSLTPACQILSIRRKYSKQIRSIITLNVWFLSIIMTTISLDNVLPYFIILAMGSVLSALLLLGEQSVTCNFELFLSRSKIS
ncbi:hypothetical protein L9F63_002705, partial [Diploptera punctata]